MKECLIYFLLSSIGSILYSQNLVPNPSFEQYDTCPYTYSQIHFANSWFGAVPSKGGGSSDLYSQCSNSTYVDVPNNDQGYQNARTGSSYAGIGVWSPREYIEVVLDSPLVSGKKYHTSFYVSLADKMRYAIDAIGAYFSSDTLFALMTPPSPAVQPQIKNPAGNLISDTLNWFLISGSFVANGGEKFMTIGNFEYDSLTTVDTVSGNQVYAYYYIDDISVIDSGWVGINDALWNNDFTISPNPSPGIFTIKTEQEIKSIDVISVLGEKVQIGNRRYAGGSNRQEIDLTNLPNGIYFARVQTEKGIVSKKLVVAR